MNRPIIFSLTAAMLLGTAPASADSSAANGLSNGKHSGRELPAYLQCVPYARDQSGIRIYGDAHTWWGQAEGKFARGNKPKVGAVMAFQPHRNMRLGHVAAVSKIIDSRTVLLRHANWSPINGRRGQIEKDVRAIDVSAKNDWSEVRVWYHPIQALGGTPWPIHGFIYPDKARSFGQAQRVARAAPKPRPVAPAPSQSSRKTSQNFASAFATFEANPRSASPVRSAQVRSVSARPRRVASAVTSRAAVRTVNHQSRQNPRNDFADILAKYD